MFVLFLVSCAPAAQQEMEKESKELPAVRIGFIGPLSGEVSNLGADGRAGVELAVNEINNAGGVNGRMVEVIYEDGKCNGKDAATAATKLIDIDKVPFIVGGLCSGETLAAAPIAEQAQVALISYASSSPDISKSGDYVFRTWPSDAGQGSAIAAEMLKRGHHKVAVIYANTDYSAALANVFKENFEGSGGVITSWEAYDQEAKDFRTQVVKARASQPNAIYLVSYPRDGALLIRQIRELKMTLPLYGSETLGSKDVVESAGKENIEGLVYATPKFDPAWIKAQDFLTKGKAFRGGDFTIPAVGADAYDAVYLIAEALSQRPEQEPTGAIVKDFLYTVENWDGAGGRLTIDENGDALKDFQIMYVHEGDFRVAP